VNPGLIVAAVSLTVIVLLLRASHFNLFFSTLPPGEVTTSFSFPEFCPPGFRPTVLGIAPALHIGSEMWDHITAWVDPASGCVFQSTPSDRRTYTVFLLSDSEQVALSYKWNPELVAFVAARGR